MDNLDTEVELCDVGMQTLPDGSQIKLPNVLLGIRGKDPEKKTVSRSMVLIFCWEDALPYSYKI